MDIELKLAILKSGKHQWQIAREADISESKLSKHLRGYGHLNEAELCRLSTVLAMDVEQEFMTVGEEQ
jgi:DNA-binding CsgD family transcriptional regulator